MLFATLDPTLRALTLPHGGKTILSDTVGFISDLPTHLVAAFRATLEEVLEADSFCMSATSRMKTPSAADDVDTVLRQLGIDPDAGQRFSKSGTRSIASIPNSARTCAISPPVARLNAHVFWSRPKPARASMRY